MPSEPDDAPAAERLRAALAPRLTLTRELGRGGMSVVYAAHEERLERDVAVKVLVPSADGDVDAERFRREILLLARLQHPHVVPVLRDGVADGRPYLVMPLVEGESLRERLRRGGPLPVGEAVRVLRAVAAALAYAHARGVVHRDVKPDNVLLSAGGAATVSDFGVARAIAVARAGDGASDAGLVVGTPAYMAPEQAAGDPAADHRVDLYAFGVLAYELLTGATPFAGRTGLARLTAQLTEAPPPIAERRPDLPPRVASLVMRCLQLDPAHRPADATYLVAVLDALLAPGGEVERRDPPPRAARTVRARTAFALGFAVALAGAVLGGARWAGDAPAGAAADADAPRRRVLVADFGGAGADPVLSGVLADAVRSDLGASAALTPLSAAALTRAARALCGTDAPGALDADRAVALAAAAAPPAAAVVDGAVRGVEGARVVSLRALEPATGRVLAAHRATANTLVEVMPTVDRLAGQLLRDIERRADAPPAAGPPAARPCAS